MKPCRKIKTIRGLIEHHEYMARAHQLQVQEHQQRVEVLKEYIHELTKPGFKQSVYIKVGGTARTEPFVTTASDSFGEGG